MDIIIITGALSCELAAALLAAFRGYSNVIIISEMQAVIFECSCIFWSSNHTGRNFFAVAQFARINNASFTFI